jgi:hypothetical protein
MPDGKAQCGQGYGCGDAELKHRKLGDAPGT